MFSAFYRTHYTIHNIKDGFLLLGGCFLKGLESVLLFVLIIISSLKGNRQNVVI